MKISLTWVFDHIAQKPKNIDVKNIVHLFNTHVAEIEHYETISYPVHSWYIGIARETSKLFCPELKTEIELSPRTDIQIGASYLIKKDGSGFSWLSFADAHSDATGLFPALDISEQHSSSGAWRNDLAVEDYIIDVDNKSINHRPDLWCHYGIASELAAILSLPLKPLSSVLSKHPVIDPSQQSSWRIMIEDTEGCSRLAGLYIEKTTFKYSDINTAFQLLKVGGKPVNGMVDLTNFVMFDIGHPMHVFNAKALPDKTLKLRKARNEESILLLDKTSVTLTERDMVISNNNEPIAVAGIMGGLNSSYTKDTTSIFIEAGGFNPTTIRHTAQRFKLRTEASIRFEKHLDPMQNITALQRFLYKASEQNILSESFIKEPIISCGVTIEPRCITVSHHEIETKIGIPIESTFIENTLRALQCQVAKKTKDNMTWYDVIVPTRRMTKDLKIAEDIIEEIARIYGYAHITYKDIERPAIPFNTDKVTHISRIKHHLAFASMMHETQDYLLFDEQFLQKLSFNPTDAVHLKNPGSENWKRLVTSLVPHLFKSISVNTQKSESLRFFEWNSIWNKLVKNYNEASSLAGICAGKNIDFYHEKKLLQDLFHQLALPISWKKSNLQNLAPWYDPYKTAELWVDSIKIGYAGMGSLSFYKDIYEDPVFIFELQGDFLCSWNPAQKTFKPFSKYQHVSYDVSLLVPVEIAATTLQAAIQSAHSDIMDVYLVDFFEKSEWKQMRALTFRYYISNMTKTLNKEELDIISNAVHTALEPYHVQIR